MTRTFFIFVTLALLHPFIAEGTDCSGSYVCAMNCAPSDAACLQACDLTYLQCRAQAQLSPNRAVAGLPGAFFNPSSRSRALALEAGTALAKFNDAKAALEQIEKEWNDVITLLTVSGGSDEAVAVATAAEASLNARRAEALRKLDEATTQLTQAKIAAQQIASGPIYILNPQYFPF